MTWRIPVKRKQNSHKGIYIVINSFWSFPTLYKVILGKWRLPVFTYFQMNGVQQGLLEMELLSSPTPHTTTVLQFSAIPFPATTPNNTLKPPETPVYAKTPSPERLIFTASRKGSLFGTGSCSHSGPPLPGWARGSALQELHCPGSCARPSPPLPASGSTRSRSSLPGLPPLTPSC